MVMENRKRKLPRIAEGLVRGEMEQLFTSKGMRKPDQVQSELQGGTYVIEAQWNCTCGDPTCRGRIRSVMMLPDRQVWRARLNMNHYKN